MAVGADTITREPGLKDRAGAFKASGDLFPELFVCLGDVSL